MWFSRFAKNLKRSCKYITLHGFMNISESKSGIEMAFWLCVQCLCFVLCIWLMTIHWFRYASRPTVTSIKSTAFPISKIPFPAITICNSNVVNKRYIQYYEKLLKRSGINETHIAGFFKHLKHLIFVNSAGSRRAAQFEDIEDILNQNDINPEKLMKNVMHPCNEMLLNCSWSSVNYNCSQMFRPIKTGLGFCCSFNYFNDVSESSSIAEEFKEPAVVEGAGMTHGLSVSINIGVEDYASSIFPFYACFVLAHPIWDFSDLATFSTAVQPGDFALMQLVPTVYTTDDNLQTVSVSMRECWFEDEGNLETTQDYSFTNCVIECKQKIIFEFCKCVPFFYPREFRKHCTLQDVPCLQKYESLYNSVKLTDKNVENSSICNCLPQCGDISYDGYSNIVRSTMPTNISTVYIYFDHAWCVEYNMSLNLTWDMLLASLGGIFGLCLGGSLISLIECIFYLIKSIILTFVQGRQLSAPVKEFNQKKIFNIQPQKFNN